MTQFFNFKSIFFPLLLTIFTANGSQAACYFPINEAVVTIQKSKKERKVKRKSKPKSHKQKATRSDKFGNLALWSLIAALVSSLLGAFMIGTILIGLFFVASCGFAIYGLYKDENKRKARVILIINLALILSFVASFWIIALFTL